MALPGVDFTIEDGGLGLTSGDASAVGVAIGVSSQGPVNTVLTYSSATPMRAQLGEGPLVENLAFMLSAGGAPQKAIRVTASVAGTVGTVTKTGTGTGTVTVAGTPLDGYDVRVEITRDGANIAANTGAFTYSLDGGATPSAEIAIPVSGVYVIPNTGLTITFVNGGAGTSFVTGDRHTFTTTAPGFTATDANTAIDALFADGGDFGFIHLVGTAATPAGAATLAAAIDARMTEAESRYRYAFAIVGAPAAAQADLKTAFAAFTSKRTAIAAGTAALTSMISGRSYTRSVAWSAAARASAAPIDEDLARVASGPLPNVTKLFYDEYATPGLDEAGFITARTIPNVRGFYLTNGRLMAPVGSDFQYIHHRRIMDRAMTVLNAALVQLLNDAPVRVVQEPGPTAGHINEVDARAIDTELEAVVAAALGDGVTGVSVRVRRDVNIISTQRLDVAMRITPRGYIKFIEASVGFQNPALALQAA